MRERFPAPLFVTIRCKGCRTGSRRRLFSSRSYVRNVALAVALFYVFAPSFKVFFFTKSQMSFWWKFLCRANISLMSGLLKPRCGERPPWQRRRRPANSRELSRLPRSEEILRFPAHADTARKGWLLLKISPWMDFMWLNHVKSGVVQLQGQGES